MKIYKTISKAEVDKGAEKGVQRINSFKKKVLNSNVDAGNRVKKFAIKGPKLNKNFLKGL